MCSNRTGMANAAQVPTRWGLKLSLSWWLGGHCWPWQGLSHHRGEGRNWKTMNWGTKGRQERGVGTAHLKPKLRKLPGLPPTYTPPKAASIFALLPSEGYPGVHSPHRTALCQALEHKRECQRLRSEASLTRGAGQRSRCRPRRGRPDWAHEALGKEHLQAFPEGTPELSPEGSWELARNWSTWTKICVGQRVLKLQFHGVLSVLLLPVKKNCAHNNDRNCSNTLMLHVCWLHNST